MSMRLRQILMDKAGDGGAGAGGGAGDAGKGAQGAGDDKGSAGAGADKGGAGAGDKGTPAPWMTAVAGEDKEILAALKDVPDPKALVEAYTGQARWRENLAGENKDALKTLERFASPKALWESYDALRGRMSKGELRSTAAFPDKGTAEQQAAWRAENGLPTEPGKYQVQMAEGVELSDADKPMIEGFKKFAFERHLPAAAVNDVVNWFFSNQMQAEQTASDAFEKKRTETAADLGREWGTEYKANLNKIQGVLDSTIPGDQKELKELINRAIATNPHFARHYAAIALQLNPAGTLVPGDRGANEASVSDGIKAIEKTMRTKRSEYDKDSAMQQQYRDLLAAYSKLTGKEWGRA